MKVKIEIECMAKELTEEGGEIVFVKIEPSFDDLLILAIKGDLTSEIALSVLKGIKNGGFNVTMETLH